MNDYYTELANRDKATKPIKIIGVEEISCRCPNDNYEVGWGVPEEELDLQIWLESTTMRYKINTTLVLTQVIRVTQNHIQLKNFKKTDMQNIKLIEDWKEVIDKLSKKVE